MTVGHENRLTHCELADQLSHTENEDELLRAVLDQVRDNSSVDWVTVYLVDEKNKTILLNPRYALIRDGRLKRGHGMDGLEEREVRWKNSVVGSVARSKEGLLLGETEIASQAKDLTFDFGLAEAVLVLPLIANRQTVGVLAAGQRRGELNSEDVVLLRLVTVAAAAHWSRQEATRQQGARSKALQKLGQGLADSSKLLHDFRQSYRQNDFLTSLCRVALSLIRAEGCLALTYDSSTDGLWPEGCYRWDRSGEHAIQASDHRFVALIRYLRGRTKSFVEPDLSAERAGPFGKLELTDPFLCAAVTPISLFSGRQSFLVLLSWSRNGFGSVDLSILGLVQQLLEVLALAHDTQATIDYLQRTAVMAHQIAGTTHELRNYVTYTLNDLDHIETTLTTLATHAASPELAEQLGQLAVDAADAAAECRKARHRVEILRHFRLKGQVRLSVQEFALNELLEDVRRTNQDLADSKDIRIETEYDLAMPRLQSDPILIRECVGNLLLNSIYFTNPKGRIVIGSRYQRQVPLPVRVSVYDEGGGIHTSELQKIFEPFYSTKTSPGADDHSGTGLGLFLTRNNVELLGGKIEVESVVPRSTRFTIQLPLKYS